MAPTRVLTSDFRGAGTWADADAAEKERTAAIRVDFKWASVRSRVERVGGRAAHPTGQTLLGRLSAIDFLPATACERVMQGTRSPCSVTSNCISSSRRKACTVSLSP